MCAIYFIHKSPGFCDFFLLPKQGKQKFQETNKELIIFSIFLVNFCYDSKCVFVTINDLCIDLVYI